MNRPLRTMHVRVGSPYGGPERFLEHLFRRTDPNTYEAVLVSLVRDCVLAERIRAMDRPVEIVEMPSRFNIASARRAIVELIEHYKPDVIHTYGIRSNLVVGPSAKRLGVPWVLRLPNVNRLDYRNPLAGWGSYLLNNALLRRADVVHVISEALRDHVQSLWFPPKRIELIPNGVDLSHFCPSTDPENLRRSLFEKHSLPLSCPWIGVSMGRLIPLKGYDLLIEAWAKLSTDLPGAVLFLLGDGFQLEELKARAKDLGIAENVIFPGFVDDIVPYLQSASVYIQSSRVEGVSQALLEAMACGLPAIATDVGGTRMIVEDRKNGWLIPSENLSALHAALHEAAHNAETRMQLAQTALDCVREKWSVERMVQSVLDLDYSLAQETCSRG